MGSFFLLLVILFTGSDCFPTRPVSKISAPSISKHYPGKPIAITNYHRNVHSQNQLRSFNGIRERPPSSLSANLRTTASTVSIIALDTLFRKSFHAMSIQFPSSLAGCTALFMILLLLHSCKKEWGDYWHGLLNPGATLLAKWLPVFFVPSLVTLPLAPSLGSTQEVK